MVRKQRVRSIEEVEAALNAGEWLQPGEVGVLFGKSRQAVHNWIKQGRIGYRKAPLSGFRECDPQDVRKLLDEYRHVHHGPSGG